MTVQRAVLLMALLSTPMLADNALLEATRLNNEAVRLANAQKYEAAERLYRNALALDSVDTPTRATIYSNLAAVYRRMDCMSDAEQMYRRALELRRQIFPPGHVQVLRSLNNLAEMYRIEGRYWEARNLFEAAIQGLEKTDPNNADLPYMLNNLAVVLSALGEFDALEQMLGKALQSSERVAGPSSRQMAITLSHLAQVLERNQDFDNAALHYSRSLAIFEALGPEARMDLAGVLAGLGQMYSHQSRFEEARQAEKRALALLQSAPELNGALRAEILANLGEITATAGNASASAPYFEQSLAIREKILGREHPLVAQVLLNYAGAMMRAGKKALAHKLQKRAEQLLAKRRDEDFGRFSVSADALRSGQ